MNIKPKAEALIADLDVTVTVEKGRHTEYVLDAPTGYVFAANGASTVTYLAYHGLKNLMWSDIVSDLRVGLKPAA